MELTGKWRYRISYFGKIVLQVEYIPMTDTCISPSYTFWRDADMHDVTSLHLWGSKDSEEPHIYSVGSVPRSKPQWVPKDNDLVVRWSDGDYPTAIVGMAYLYKSIVIGKHAHCAKVESLSDIGNSISWFMENRNWI